MTTAYACCIFARNLPCRRGRGFITQTILLSFTKNPNPGRCEENLYVLVFDDRSLEDHMVPSTKSASHRPLSPKVAKSLASTLRAERLLRELTQEDLASKSQISVQLVRRLEAGTSNPTLGTLVSVAVALGVKPSDLLSSAGV